MAQNEKRLGMRTLIEAGDGSSERCTRGELRAPAWPRPALILATFAALVIVSGCSRSAEHDEGESGSARTAPARSAPKASAGVVEIRGSIQQQLQLRVQALTAASLPPEVKGYGRVLDPTPLAALVTDLAGAEAAASASEQELLRLRSLLKQDNASVRAVQAAEAAAIRDRLQVSAARNRIALSWGNALARRRDLPALIDALAAQTRLIVRIDIPPDALPSSTPRGARLVGLDRDAPTMDADYLGAAPSVDAQSQGHGFLFLTRGNALALRSDAAVQGYIALEGEALAGVLLPRTALVRYDAQPWVYIQKTDTLFTRTPVVLEQPLNDGWWVRQGLSTSDRVVVQGAQVLLSEELRSQLTLGD